MRQVSTTIDRAKSVTHLPASGSLRGAMATKDAEEPGSSPSETPSTKEELGSVPAEDAKKVLSEVPGPRPSEAPPSLPPGPNAGHAPHGSMGALVLGALGIVFGDIGTSPLYTLAECTHGPHGVEPNRDNVLGVLSLIVWSLMFVVTVKYLVFIMRADNKGEGGILALLALLPERIRASKEKPVTLLAVLIIAGAALLYGDGMITPAISVLAAVEGLKTVSPAFTPYVIPLTVVILIALFMIQSRGTGTVGVLFGPVMALWFLTIGGLGAYHASHNTAVFAAVSPTYAVAFFVHHGKHGFMVLGSVVLAVTGGEALYADMGHFGKKPIRLAWVIMVLPCLLLAYFGQGAVLLAHPEAAESPFFAMSPGGNYTVALVVLATMATVIASQALISGAFSLTQQAISLGYFPRVTVRHTSKDAEGQIYVPQINWLLMVACILLVLTFRESSRLAAAYGIAVTGTMAITSIAFFTVMRENWKWPLPLAGAVLAFFLAFDLPFFAANAMKFKDGGWVPVAIAAVFLVVMVVWRRGRFFLGRIVGRKAKTTEDFLTGLPAIPRKKGCGIFMGASPTGVPNVLNFHAERLGVIEEELVLVAVTETRDPYVEEKDRVVVERLTDTVYRVTIRFGFMDTPEVPAALALAKKKHGMNVKLADATYFLGRESFVASSANDMGALEESFFAMLSRNATPATAYFALPPERVVELGTMVDL
jgi:KUP system potassium uptake protein